MNTLRQAATTLTLTDVVVPLTDGRSLKLRCIVRPDGDQAVLLDRLGLQLPKRLRIPSASTPMSCKLGTETAANRPLRHRLRGQPFKLGYQAMKID
jgi:hypothetical protein